MEWKLQCMIDLFSKSMLLLLPSLRETLRWNLENTMASSKIFSPSYPRNDASYRLNIPFASLTRLSLKLPFSSLNLSNISAETSWPYSLRSLKHKAVS
ncbi:hypothetical protein VIGAN_06146300, partial [Vigna angularis var. angularis]